VVFICCVISVLVLQSCSVFEFMCLLANILATVAFLLNVCLHGTGLLFQVPVAGFNIQWVAIMLLSTFAQLCVRLLLWYAMLNKTCVVH
jgi:hypothetical protein